MAKTGREKNTKNKAKHSKLMAKKKNKKKAEETLRKERLKAIILKAKEENDAYTTGLILLNLTSFP